MRKQLDPGGGEHTLADRGDPGGSDGRMDGEVESMEVTSDEGYWIRAEGKAIETIEFNKLLQRV